jgi:K+-sensing histidine kinase KdpD
LKIMSNLPPEQDAPLPRQIVLEPTSSLDLPVSAPEPAKLRVYLGAAPGVGKTYHMLQDANLLRKQGVDIVVGLVESHGRAETEAQVKELEVIPQRQIPYRSVVLKEMDLDAILARKPHIVIVDELALRGRARTTRRGHQRVYGIQHSAP